MSSRVRERARLARLPAVSASLQRRDDDHPVHRLNPAPLEPMRAAMKRRTFTLGTILALFAPALRAVAAPIKATLYKDPQCGCCEGYVAYLRENGFVIDVKPTNDLAEISRKAGVTANLQGCHTMFVDRYVVDG